ncbi:hypothetical protein NDI56_16800 [Haloarcula sp. S1CR25-12]|uniref:Twin-arginine translocation signal domain-containing protein n=1 Tax=Haloarcula saliterrae TaxID=2950534 RepID=A0ABU2FFL7_9EURY|nr:hypothetical protein [Haloarcula sp. S1CR25-12]MDS0261059.1 hypothetical protein [Haloarcula sp. S1CR25-12]
MDVPATPTRRDALRIGGALITTAAAGCNSLSKSGSTGLVLHNALDVEVRVMVTVTNANRDEPILDSEVVTVARGDRLVVSDDIPRENGHLVTVSVDIDEQPSAELAWKQVTEPLHVIIHRDDIVFTVEPSE